MVTTVVGLNGGLLRYVYVLIHCWNERSCHEAGTGIGDVMLESVIALLAAFLATFFTLKLWIPAAKRFGLVGRDINKYDRPDVAEAGGFAVVLSIALGLFFYLFLKAFWGTSSHLAEIYATISALLLAGFVGFVDDLLGWKKGLPQWFKPLLTLFLAIPFMTLAFLHPEYNSFAAFGVPLWIYALILVPVGVVGASNALNMLAGYNGLEAGLSLLLLLFIGMKAFTLGNLWVAYMAFIGVASLLAFLFFNWYPAKVFPGDTLTYAMGTYVAALAILGNLEIFAIALFPLFFLELILKARSRFRAENFGIPDENNVLHPRYNRVYSVTHIFLRIPGMTERRLVLSILALQFLISLAAFILF